MTRDLLRALLLATGLLALGAGPAAPGPPRGVRLGDLTWIEAAKILRPESVVVIPIGAASKEHGPHLKLSNDLLLADYFTARVLREADVVVAPTVTYSYYPAFVEYPGSTTLRLETARDMLIDICRSLARHGPRRFYALNTGISTLKALAPAAETLAQDGILLRYTNLGQALKPAEDAVRQQARGTHADEIETSMMLYIEPSAVDMSRAVRDDHEGTGPLTREPNGAGVYSASGIWGDPTLATRRKGKLVSEALVKALLEDVEATRTAPLPSPGVR